MRCPIGSLLAVALATAVCGCAQTGRLAGPMAWLKKPEPKLEAEAEQAPFRPEKDAADAETKTASKDPPPAATTPAVDAKPTETVADAKPAEPPKDAEPPKKDKKDSDPPAGRVHDAETLALIDEELKGASPEEREKLRQQLEEVLRAGTQGD